MGAVILVDIVAVDYHRGPEARVDKPQHGQMPDQLRPQFFLSDAIAAQRSAVLFFSRKTFLPDLREQLRRFVHGGYGILSSLNLLTNDVLIDEAAGRLFSGSHAQVRLLSIQKAG